MTSTADTAAFRILLHVDAKGTVRLIKDLTILQTTNTVQGALKTIFVLVTDPSLTPKFTGVVPRGGKLVWRRFGSAPLTTSPPTTRAFRDASP